MPTPRDELADSIDSNTGEHLFPVAAGQVLANSAAAAGIGGSVTSSGTITAEADAALAANPSEATTDQPMFVSPNPTQNPGTTT